MNDFPSPQIQSHHAEQVLILDAGAQYGKVIDRRVRELNVDTQLLPLHTPASSIQENPRIKAIIISGGPQSVYAPNAPKFDGQILRLGLPVLGICYGMQLLAHNSGSVVEKKSQREDGQFTIKVDTTSQLFDSMQESQQVLLTHGDTVQNVGEGWKVTSKSGGMISSMENAAQRLYGVQFHPEVDLTENGKHMFKNFLFKIAALKGDYTMYDRKMEAWHYIDRIVGDKKVLLLVSGGVDSSVCAALMTKPLGDRLIALHIDNGFMRKDESKLVKVALESVGLNLKVVDASEQFYSATTSITKDGHTYQTKRLDETLEPEEKRKIIGDTFVKIAQAEIQKLGLSADEVFLGQGTLRPDLIESASHLASASASVIKTHHNDTSLIRELRSRGRVIEPLAEYHKDEVRALGRDLGLPPALVDRQPFPGPGLSIRIICSEKAYKDALYAETNQKLKRLVTEFSAGAPEFAESSAEEIQLLTAISKKGQIAARILPMQTVGVQGDGRSYSYLCALSASGDPNSPPWADLFALAKLIPKIIHNVNRVCFVFGDKLSPDLDLDITPTKLTKDVIRTLQVADDIVNTTFIEANEMSKLSQAPVILFPISFAATPGLRSVAIRTLITHDFMTGRPAVPGVDIKQEVLNDIVARVLKVEGIGRVVYDLSTKPPATTEWE